MQVAIPEFDGRIIGPPSRFKEPVGRRLAGRDAGATTRPTSSAARASPASPSATRACARWPGAEQRIAIVLSAYPTKHARIGNAVGLDTPASAIALLERLRDAGYRVEHDFAGRRRAHPRADRRRRPRPRSSSPTRSSPRAAGAPAGRRVRALVRRRCPPTLRERVIETWGPAARRAVRRRRRPRARRPRARQRLRRHPAAPRLRREPGRRSTTTPTSPPAAPLPRRLPLAATTASAPTPSSTSASTARWNGCRARASGSRPPARPTPPWATCRSSTPSSSTTPARARRPSAAPTP